MPSKPTMEPHDALIAQLYCVLTVTGELQSTMTTDQRYSILRTHLAAIEEAQAFFRPARSHRFTEQLEEML